MVEYKLRTFKHRNFTHPEVDYLTAHEVMYIDGKPVRMCPVPYIPLNGDEALRLAGAFMRLPIGVIYDHVKMGEEGYYEFFVD